MIADISSFSLGIEYYVLALPIVEPRLSRDLISLEHFNPMWVRMYRGWAGDFMRVWLHLIKVPGSFRKLFMAYSHYTSLGFVN